VLTEDTALEFKALKGLPGPYMYVHNRHPRLLRSRFSPSSGSASSIQTILSDVCCSKYFLAALGHTGLNNLLVAYPDKTAYAVCTFAYCGGPGQDPILFQDRTEGKIVDARGPPTFGWDAVFEYEGETYAEMDKARKVSSIPCSQ